METHLPRERPLSSSLPERMLWLLLGLLALALSLVGLVLPIFPGLPFAILAGLCFATASRRLQLRLERVPVLRRPLRDWHRARRAGPRALIATASGLAALAVLEGSRSLSRMFRSKRDTLA